ncbi:MAG: hypothetical protein LBT71_07940 [Azoarcus sp.]|nr:hypothetical protein [Azoarcus sp.]
MKLALSLFLIAASLSAEIALACRCAAPAARRAYADADAVALVSIGETDALPDGVLRARADVLRVWKSALAKSVDIFTSNTDTCEFPMQKDDEALLYLRRNDNGNLETYNCWGNLPKSRSKIRIKWLNRHGKVHALKETSLPGSPAADPARLH